MRVIRDVKKLQQEMNALRLKGHTIGFVPTMGSLHEGHLHLVRLAKKKHDICVVSIYVNPKQFGVHEDIVRYPRNLKVDSSLLKKENVDICFLPSDNDIYPKGFLTTVNIDGISNVLCGAFRPGHFQGVATVVAKLLNIVGMCDLYLGAKDAQQVVVLKRMIQDLNFPVRIVVGETVRDVDGLALSSRNAYLNSEERLHAVCLYNALCGAKQMIESKKNNVKDVERMMRFVFSKYALAKVQYIAIVDSINLEPLKVLQGEILIALAVYIGKTRLIDNVVVTIYAPKKIKN
jgi:pantoate--beta-alanine ligase